MRHFIVITTDNKVSIEETATNLLEFLQEKVDGNVEFVHHVPTPLGAVTMVVNEEGLLRDDLGVNEMGSALYMSKTLSPAIIKGTVVLGQLVTTEEGPDVAGLTYRQAMVLHDLIIRLLAAPAQEGES